jgi:hypothetical protein
MHCTLRLDRLKASVADVIPQLEDQRHCRRTIGSCSRRRASNASSTSSVGRTSTQTAPGPTAGSTSACTPTMSRSGASRSGSASPAHGPRCGMRTPSVTSTSTAGRTSTSSRPLARGRTDYLRGGTAARSDYCDSLGTSSEHQYAGEAEQTQELGGRKLRLNNNREPSERDAERQHEDTDCRLAKN